MKNASDVQAKWDGQFKSDYTIPAYVVAAAWYKQNGRWRMPGYTLG